MSLPPVPPAPPVIDPARVAEVARRVDFRLRSRGLWPTVTVDGARVVVVLPRPTGGDVATSSASYARAFHELGTETYAEGLSLYARLAVDMEDWIIANETAAAMIAWEAAQKAKRA